MTAPDDRRAEGPGGLNRSHKVRRPAWIKAWAVLAALVFVWGAAMLLAPDRCSIISHCPWTSDFAIGLLGAPVILVALLVALVLSAIAWWRRG